MGIDMFGMHQMIQGFEPVVFLVPSPVSQLSHLIRPESGHGGQDREGMLFAGFDLGFLYKGHVEGDADPLMIEACYGCESRVANHRCLTQI